MLCSGFRTLLFNAVLLLLLTAVSCRNYSKEETGSPLADNADTVFLNYNQGKFFPNIAFERFGVEDGLCSASVSALMQDKKGLIWIGTDSGLNRYDGREFKGWINDPENPASIPAAGINDMAEDSKGNIWLLMPGKGLCRFDPDTESFTLFSDTVDILSGLNHYNKILLDHKDRIWVKEGYFDANKCIFVFVHEKGTYTGNHHFLDKNGDVLFLDKVQKKLLKYSENENKFKVIADSFSFSMVLEEGFRKILADKNGSLSGITHAGYLYRIHPFSGAPQEVYFANHQISKDSVQYSLGGTMMDVCYSEATGLVWVAQWGGLSRVDLRPTANPKIFRYTIDENNEFSLPDRVATCVIEDRSGALWVGTYTGGVAKFAPAKNQFTVFKKVPGDTTSLSNNIVTAIFEDSKGRLWAGTKKYLNRIDLKTGKAQLYKNKKTDVLGCNHPWIQSITEDPETGKLLLTYWGAGFNWFDPETGEFSKPEITNINFTDPCWMFLRKAEFYNKDTVLLYEWSGVPLHLYDKKNRTLISTGILTQNGKTLDIGLASYGLLDHQHNIWLGFGQEKGLLRTRLRGKDSMAWHSSWISPVKDTLITSADHHFFQASEKDSSGLNSGTIHHIFEDHKFRLWIGTPNGLYLLENSEKGIFRRFGKKHGFTDLNIASILEDDRGLLWVSTNSGIFQFDPVVGKVKQHFDYKDGLPGNQFSSGACFKNKKGELFFGGLKGMVAFHPDSMGSNHFAPPALILNVFADEKEIPLHKGITEIEIPPSTVHIRIEYTALDFTRPEFNLYQYYLEGFDNKVSEVTNETKAVYTNVKPGSYRFHLKAANSDGVWNNEGVVLNFYVLPEWYETWLFQVVVVSLTIFAIYLFFKRRIKQIREYRNKELQLKSLQVNTHQAQMNPHFIFNVLTAIKSLVSNKKPEEAGEYLDKFAVLIRRYLDSSVKSDTTRQRSVVENEISLAQEIELIDMYVEFEQLKYENKFDYIRLAPDFVVENVSVPPMLIQPFVENAIKHGLLNLPPGQKGFLKVSFMLKTDDTLVCIIEDNGVGREEAGRIKKASLKHFQSLGVSLTEQRKEILNQLGYHIQITPRDREGGGTIVEIKIA